MKETESTLLAIGEFLEIKSGSFSVGKKSNETLIEKALFWLKEKLCSQKQEIIERARSSEADIAVIIAEIVLFALGNNIPGIPTLTKSIAQVGINRFCDDPVVIISGQSNE